MQDTGCWERYLWGRVDVDTQMAMVAGWGGIGVGVSGWGGVRILGWLVFFSGGRGQLLASPGHLVGDTCSASLGNRCRVAERILRGAETTVRASSGCSLTIRMTFEPRTRNDPCSSLVASAKFADERPIDCAAISAESGCEAGA